MAPIAWRRCLKASTTFASQTIWRAFRGYCRAAGRKLALLLLAPGDVAALHLCPAPSGVQIRRSLLLSRLADFNMVHYFHRAGILSQTRRRTLVLKHVRFSREGSHA